MFNTTDSLKQHRQLDEGLQLLTDYLDQAPESELNDDLIMADVYYTKGDLLRQSNRSRESINAARKAVEFYKKAGLAQQMGDCYSLIGNNHMYLGNYEEALLSFKKALEIDEMLGNNINVAVALNSIGKAYELCKEFDKALEFFTRSLEIVQDHNLPNMVAIRLASIASIHKNQNQYDKALQFLNKAIEIEIAQNNEVRKGYRLDMMGEIYSLKKEFNTAEKYLNEALLIFRNNNIRVSESIVLNHLAFNAFKQGLSSRAVEYYHKSLDIAEAVSFRNMLEKNHQELSQLYELEGNYKNALEHYHKYVALRDSSVTEKTREQLLDFQVMYETQEKEKELALLNQEKLAQDLQLNKAKQQRTIYISILGISFMLLFALYSRFLIKEKSQKELAALNVQLNDLNSTKDKLFSIIAHDLKNNISAFSNLLATLNKRIEVMTAHDMKYFLAEMQISADALKRMLKNLLDWALSQQNKIKVETTEIELANFMEELSGELQPLTQSRNIVIEYRIGSDSPIRSDRNILQTVFRNILSNCIKYSPDNSKIELFSERMNGSHVFTIRDFGLGMEQDTIDSIINLKHVNSKPGVNGEKGTGLGLKLSIELINKLGGSIHIESLPQNGTTFIIQIPIT